MLIKKLAIALVLVLATVTLSGCGANKAADSNNQSQPKGKTQQNTVGDKKTSDSTDVPVPPKATGKVDDTVNSILQDADNEKNQADSESDSAKSAIDDSQDANNLTNSYDQNNL